MTQDFVPAWQLKLLASSKIWRASQTTKMHASAPKSNPGTYQLLTLFHGKLTITLDERKTVAAVPQTNNDLIPVVHNGLPQLKVAKCWRETDCHMALVKKNILVRTKTSLYCSTLQASCNNARRWSNTYMMLLLLTRKLIQSQNPPRSQSPTTAQSPVKTKPQAGATKSYLT